MLKYLDSVYNSTIVIAGSIHVLICEEYNSCKAEIKADMKQFSDSIGKIWVVKVTCDPPLTRQQFEDSCQLWPASFHEDKV